MLTRDAIRRAVIVAHAEDAGFVELVGMAELDRATAFRGASMRATDLRGQDFSGFDFTGATFDGADVRGADFTRAIGLTSEMFRNALVDKETKWPQYLLREVPTSSVSHREIRANPSPEPAYEAVSTPGGATTRGGSFIDRSLRERVDGDVTAFLAAFDAELVQDNQRNRSALREATDRLLRVGARTRIELERLEALRPLLSRRQGYPR